MATSILIGCRATEPGTVTWKRHNPSSGVYNSTIVILNYFRSHSQRQIASFMEPFDIAPPCSPRDMSFRQRTLPSRRDASNNTGEGVTNSDPDLHAGTPVPQSVTRTSPGGDLANPSSQNPHNRTLRAVSGDDFGTVIEETPSRVSQQSVVPDTDDAIPRSFNRAYSRGSLRLSRLTPAESFAEFVANR
ncbi:hypothetical protein EK21DRAFT_83673 [Setomelanomma holmii]|uniref:Uncharacterized protein n=1 Tax=Setomelanomma holmii TaxID=210430 RepID=A0A9P4LQZ2_9PLEO|nr:hypothetical protein EK21DRAFT_83673 [Setomelanomma holmii]